MKMEKRQKANQKIQTKTLQGPRISSPNACFLEKNISLWVTGPPQMRGEARAHVALTRRAPGQPGTQLPAHSAPLPYLSWPPLLGLQRAQGWGPVFPRTDPGLTIEVGELCWTEGRVFSPAETEPHDNRDFGLRPSLVGHLPCGLVSADRAVRDHEDEAGGQDPVPRTVEQKDGAAREPGTPLSRRRTPASAIA